MSASWILFLALWMQGAGGIPKPFVVPAVHVPAKSKLTETEHCSDEGLCYDGPLSCTNNGEMDMDTPFPHKCIKGWVWGCANKDDVLLTSESGKHWCMEVDAGVRP